SQYNKTYRQNKEEIDFKIKSKSNIRKSLRKKIHLCFLNRFPGDLYRNFENAFVGRTASKTKKAGESATS
ncbi:MAG: hypothetical protein ACI4UT_02695, partial [Candidatus Enteromonas sp.]